MRIRQDIDYGRASEDAAKLRGVYIGTVKANTDEGQDSKYRVKVKFEWLPCGQAQEMSHWARIAVPMAGDARGTYLLPEVEDQVLVVFAHGDIRFPVIIGSLWNESQKPPETNPDGKNNYRVIKSRSGHRLIFDDTEGAERVILVDSTNKNKVLLDSANQVTTLETADGDIEIQAPSGVARFHASNVKITTTGDVHAKGGMKLEVSSQGAVNAKATGTMNLNAALVQMNPGLPSASMGSVLAAAAGAAAAAAMESLEDVAEHAAQAALAAGISAAGAALSEITGGLLGADDVGAAVASAAQTAEAALSRATELAELVAPIITQVADQVTEFIRGEDVPLFAIAVGVDGVTFEIKDSDTGEPIARLSAEVEDGRAQVTWDGNVGDGVENVSVTIIAGNSKLELELSVAGTQGDPVPSTDDIDPAAPVDGGSEDEAGEEEGSSCGDSAQTEDEAGQTDDDGAGQTGDGAGQTGDGTGQTGDGTGQTGDDGAGQTGDDGAGQTGDGTGQAGDGTGQTGDGAGQAGDGTGQAGDGTGQTGDGAGQAGDGTGQAGDGTGQTGDGAGQAGDGTGQAGDGTGQTGGGTGQSGDGTVQAGDGTGQAGDGTGQAGDGAGQAETGTQQTCGGTEHEGEGAQQPSVGSQASSVKDGTIASVGDGAPGLEDVSDAESAVSGGTGGVTGAVVGGTGAGVVAGLGARVAAADSVEDFADDAVEDTIAAGKQQSGIDDAELAKDRAENTAHRIERELEQETDVDRRAASEVSRVETQADEFERQADGFERQADSYGREADQYQDELADVTDVSSQVEVTRATIDEQKRDARSTSSRYESELESRKAQLDREVSAAEDKIIPQNRTSQEVERAIDDPDDALHDYLKDKLEDD